MKTTRRVAILLLSSIALQPLQADLPAHSVSPSRQFIIFGSDAATRGAISELAEQTKANLLALLRQRDGWKTQIVINLQPQQANLPEIPTTALRVSQTGFGVKLQLDLTVGQNLGAHLIERQLLRAILVEMIYRNETDVAPGTALVEPPDWLVEGVLALTPGRGERKTLVEALSLSDKSKALEEFLGQRLDLLNSAGRTVFRAHALALIQLLLEDKGGRVKMGRYITSLSHASNDPIADLKACFPQFGDDLEKKWHSALVRLGETQAYRVLTFAESERRLDELLHVKISDRTEQLKLADLNELADRKPSPQEKAALGRMSEELLLFVATAHPVLRPIAREYQQIAALLARGKRRGIAKRLSRLGITQKELAARMGDIDDYLNWFEATQMESRSGVFNDYLKAADQSQLTASKRRDPLSVYLDALADHFEN
jgi:hypothetical protein